MQDFLRSFKYQGYLLDGRQQLVSFTDCEFIENTLIGKYRKGDKVDEIYVESGYGIMTVKKDQKEIKYGHLLTFDEVRGIACLPRL